MPRIPDVTSPIAARLAAESEAQTNPAPLQPEQGGEQADTDALSDAPATDTLDALAELSQMADQESEPVEEDQEQDSGQPPAADLDATVTLADGTVVSVGEAVAGYMRNKHHTENQQAAKKALNKFKANEQAVDALKQIAYDLIAPDLRQFEGVNFEVLASQNPEAYRKFKPIYDGLMQRVQKAAQAIQQVDDWRATNRQEATEAQWDAVKKDLSFTIPGFTDDTLTELKQAAVEQGFKPDELDASADSRLLQLIYKARQNDRLAPKTKPAPKSPKVSVSGKADRARHMNRVKDLKRRSQAGDSDASRQLLRGLIDKRSRG